MKIIVRPADGQKIIVPIPTKVLIHVFTAEKMGEILPSQLRKTLPRVLRRSKKVLQGENFIEIRSADGDEVILRL